MLEFYNSLNSFFKNNYSNLSDNLLEGGLNDFLTRLKEKQIMQDDTTVGVLISSKVCEYQKINWRKKENIIPTTNENSNNKNEN
jgi:hypothetical protein